MLVMEPLARIIDADATSLDARVTRAVKGRACLVTRFTYWYTGRPPVYEAIVAHSSGPAPPPPYPAPHPPSPPRPPRPAPGQRGGPPPQPGPGDARAVARPPLALAPAGVAPRPQRAGEAVQRMLVGVAERAVQLVGDAHHLGDGAAADDLRDRVV